MTTTKSISPVPAWGKWEKLDIPTEVSEKGDITPFINKLKKKGHRIRFMRERKKTDIVLGFYMISMLFS